MRMAERFLARLSKNRLKYVWLFAAMALIFCFAEPLSAQAGYSYSEIWLDGPTSGNPVFIEESDPWPGPYIVACGITQNEYSSYNHGAAVTVTLTSPHGRTASFGIGNSSTYACAQTRLLFDEGDIGNYVVTSNHYGCCPHYGTCNYAPTTSASARIGFTSLKMRYIPGSAYEYQRVDPCDVYCRNMIKHVRNNYIGECAGFIIPYGPFGCSIFVKITRNSTCICFDYDFN